MILFFFFCISEKKKSEHSKNGNGFCARLCFLLVQIPGSLFFPFFFFSPRLIPSVLIHSEGCSWSDVCLACRPIRSIDQDAICPEAIIRDIIVGNISHHSFPVSTEIDHARQSFAEPRHWLVPTRISRTRPIYHSGSSGTPPEYQEGCLEFLAVVVAVVAVVVVVVVVVICTRSVAQRSDGRHKAPHM